MLAQVGGHVVDRLDEVGEDLLPRIEDRVVAAPELRPVQVDRAVIRVDRRLQRRVDVVDRRTAEAGELRVRVRARRRVAVDHPDDAVGGDDGVGVAAERGPRRERREALADATSVEQLRIGRELGRQQRLDVAGGEGEHGALGERRHLDPGVGIERSAALLSAVGADDHVPVRDAIAEVQLGAAGDDLVGERLDVGPAVGIGAIGGHGDDPVTVGVDEMLLHPSVLGEVVAARRSRRDHHRAPFPVEFVAVEVEVGDPRCRAALEHLQRGSELGGVPDRHSRHVVVGDRVERVDPVVDLLLCLVDGVEAVRRPRRLEVVLDVGQLADRFRRGDDVAVDDRRDDHEAGDVGDDGGGHEAERHAPAPGAGGDDEGEPGGDRHDADDPGRRDDDVELGVAGADEGTRLVDRLHQATDEHVVERLHGGEQRAEDAELGERRLPCRAATRSAPRQAQLPGDRRSEQREPDRDGEQLAAASC